MFEANIVKYEKVNLSQREAYKIALQVIQAESDIGENNFIENEKLMSAEEYSGGAHSWMEYKEVRKATEADKAILALREKISKSASL